MKRNAKVVAVDSDTRMEISIRFRSDRFVLTTNETKKVAVEAAEKIADAIRTLPYTKYGPVNTRVTA